jgi:hypothetical protein
MHPATSTAASPPRLVRRLVIGGAVVLALAIALAPPSAGVHAQETRPVTPPAVPKVPAPPSPDSATKDGASGSATVDIRVDKGKKSVTIENTTKPGVGVTIDSDEDDSGPVVGVGPGKHGKRVRVGVFGDDREYDSVSDFAHTEPGLAFMVVMIVALVFLSPVLAIGIILWYRMRKARMMNETMLKLAEKGVVPPAEALSALAGSAAAPLAASPSAAPIYEQAKQIQRRAAWSDLRKGVILGGIGLGLTAFSMFDDGTPNSVGLVLLFVGIGYIVLWWFEDRQFAPRGGTGGVPPPPPSTGTDGVA